MKMTIFAMRSRIRVPHSVLIVVGILGWALIGIVVARDFYPHLQHKLAAPLITSPLSLEAYAALVRERGLSMAVMPPTVPLTDQTRLLLLDDLATLRSHPLANSWPAAWLCKGLSRADARLPDGATLAALRQCVDGVVDGNGRLRTLPTRVDHTLMGETLLHLYERTGRREYLDSAAAMASYLLDRSAEEGGTLAYNPAYDPSARYVDTLGMIVPFLAGYGIAVGDERAIDVARLHLREFLRCGMEPRSGLPFHGYLRRDTCTPFGLLGWGRGAGWAAVGLIDGYALLQRSGRDEVIESAIASFAEAIARVQRPDGGFGAVLLNPSAFDSSATAMLAYFLERGMRLGLIDAQYREAVERAVRALQLATRTDGTVDLAQGDAMGINRFSSSFAPSSFVQGMTIALMEELRADAQPPGS